jgi:hypothetical protein
MSADSSDDRNVADEAREIREHERRAQEHEGSERSPAGEEETGEATPEGGVYERAGSDPAEDKSTPAPPAQINPQ